MFGYVRPALDELTPEGRQAYQSAYCGLCHTMGRRHGWLSRFTLNYDFTLLALLHYESGASGDTVCRRCPAHPFRKRRVCLCGEALDAAADESIILTWHKLSDDVADHHWLAGLPSRLLRILFRPAYRRAALVRPEFDADVRREMERLDALEQERSASLDRVADTFANILSAAARDCTNESDYRAMKQLLYHLGRWIYLADAWDDLEEDRKAGRYNPLDARFNGHAAEERDYMETTMTHSLRLVCSAFQLMDFGVWDAILENIFYRGLPGVQQAVLNGQWKQLRNTKEKRA